MAKEENYAAFVVLQRACQGLVATEVKTLGGIIALLEYMAPLLQEPDAPAMPLEVGFDDQRWETAFGAFCTDLARSVAAIAAAESTVTPERVDWVAADIIAATGDLFDDYDVFGAWPTRRSPPSPNIGRRHGHEAPAPIAQEAQPAADYEHTGALCCKADVSLSV